MSLNSYCRNRVARVAVMLLALLVGWSGRSEERRVGIGCRSRWWRYRSSRRRHTRCLSDWSSDVCSSDLKIDCPRIRSEYSLLRLLIDSVRLAAYYSAENRRMHEFELLLS